MNRKNLLIGIVGFAIIVGSIGALKWRSERGAENQFRESLSPLVTKDFALTQEAVTLAFSQNTSRGEIMDTIKKDKEELADLDLQIDALASSSPLKYRGDLAVYSQWRSERLGFIRALDTWSNALLKHQVALADAQKMLDFAKENTGNGSRDAEIALKAMDAPIEDSDRAGKRLLAANQQMQETATKWLDLEDKDEMADLRREFAPNSPDLKPIVSQHLEQTKTNAAKYAKGDY